MAGVHRDGETEALGLQDDRSVDANHLALCGHQGDHPSSWVESSVGLNNIIDKPSPLDRSDRLSALTTPAVTVH
jgi:hypothetical protein